MLKYVLLIVIPLLSHYNTILPKKQKKYCIFCNFGKIMPFFHGLRLKKNFYKEKRGLICIASTQNTALFLKKNR